MTLETVSSAIDSQFGAAARAGPISPESPLAALGLFSILCRWDARTRSVECGDIDAISMETLVRGQQSNPEIQELYRNSRNTAASRWDFWLFVLRASGGRRPNFSEARLRIATQTLNDAETIRSCQWAWRVSKLLTDPETKKFFLIVAMYYLLVGQRHSADTMQLYRACFGANPSELFRHIESINPLDVEDIAIDLEG